MVAANPDGLGGHGKTASKNPAATSGASAVSGRARVGQGEPLSNLPFSLWTAGSAGARIGEGNNMSEFATQMRFPTGLKRGRLREARPSIRGASPSSTFRLYFMFNPESIQYSYSFDVSATPPAFETPANLEIPNMTQGAAIGFTLLFDRMQEVWTGQPAVVAGRSGPGRIGTLWDINALDRLLGVFHDEGTGRPNGPAFGYPIMASFGAEQGRSVEFYGYINAIQIEHIMFDANMTPTRTQVGISMTQSYLPSSGSGTPTSPLDSQSQNSRT